MARSWILAGAALLAALPSAFAQTSSVSSLKNGTLAVAAAAGTAAAAPGTTFSMLVTGVGSNATATSTSRASAASSTGGVTNTWVIRVGSTNGSLTYSPDTITGAKVGDNIQFQFYPNNHSVALGDYNNACQPIQNSTNAFFSGFMPTKDSGNLTFTVPVKDTNPMWIYCSQGKHCQEGMVAVINPPATGETLADYKQRAAQAANNVTPSSTTGGQSGSSSGTTSVAGSTASSSTTTTSATAKATNANVAASTTRASSWSIAVVAAIALLLL